MSEAEKRPSAFIAVGTQLADLHVHLQLHTARASAAGLPCATRTAIKLCFSLTRRSYTKWTGGPLKCVAFSCVLWHNPAAVTSVPTLRPKTHKDFQNKSISGCFKSYSGERTWKAIGDRLRWHSYLSRADHVRKNYGQETQNGYREIFFCKKDL